VLDAPLPPGGVSFDGAARPHLLGLHQPLQERDPCPGGRGRLGCRRAAGPEGDGAGQRAEQEEEAPDCPTGAPHRLSPPSAAPASPPPAPASSTLSPPSARRAWAPGCRPRSGAAAGSSVRLTSPP